MRRPSGMSTPSINFSAMTQKVDVDNRISLRNYYRIADSLLKQADIHREEKNMVDLYIILVRYSSLVSETIPDHRDYQTLHLKEKTFYRKKLLSVLDELETLKPKLKRQLDELDKAKVTQARQFDGANHVGKASVSYSNKQMLPAPSSFRQRNDGPNRVLPSNSVDVQFQKLSLSLPLPKQETLSRHSFFGPNGLSGQWFGPSTEMKVNYPTTTVTDLSEIVSLDQVSQHDSLAKKDNDLRLEKSSMASVLSLDDGRWLSEESGHSLVNGMENKDIEFGNIVQLSPPPVMAQMQKEILPIPPHLVADPRPGPRKDSNQGLPNANTYQDLHIPVKMLDDFLRLARQNTAKNLETCGVLAGSLRNKVFHISTLIIPKQEATSDSCQTLNEEEIFEVQDSRSLFPLGWIHTHPSQTCFMSSVDLHTHYSYQVMLPEAIAIVMAPTDTSSPHGIFHLSDPSGISVIRKCDQRGFHPHEEPEDGSPLYEHCSHVYMNANLKFDVVDLRCT